MQNRDDSSINGTANAGGVRSIDMVPQLHAPFAARPGKSLFRRVVRLLDAAVTVEFNIDDEPGCLALAALSAPTIAEVLRDAVVLLDEVRGYYESDRASTAAAGQAPDSLNDIGALISTQVAAQEISDLAFVTRSEVRHCLAALETAIGSQDPPRIVVRCDDAVQRLRRGMIPLENAIGEYEGVAPPIRVWWDLEISLRIRSLYAGLRHLVVTVPPPTDGNLRSRFDEVTRELVTLRSAEIYRFMRIDDRIQMRVLHRRMELWLGQTDENDPVEGQRLWQELVSFVQLLVGVNNRQELQAHDQRVIARACQVLLEAEPRPDHVPRSLLEELGNVVGRDDELDRLILDGGASGPTVWEEVLLRLRESLAMNDGSRSAATDPAG